ncbi:hypothetical protein FV228_09965, partial [Methylobacterium sp. WL18]
MGNRNRWSRLVLTFGPLPADHWYEFSAYVLCAAAEAAADAKDFAALGLEFLAQDGSGIEFAQVPGLARTAIDMQGDWLAGPSRGRDADMRTVVIRRCFLLPAPAAQAVVVIRSWRNSHAFRVGDPMLRPVAPDGQASGAQAVGPAGS